MKKIMLVLLSLTMLLSIVGCGNDDTKVSEDNASTGQVYTVDAAELDPNIHPEDYPLINISEFESAFEKLKEANMSGELDTYEDVSNIFTIDGAYYENCDNDYEGTMYKYYGWYADNGNSILVTFKEEDNKLKYHAYTSNGIE